MFCTLKGYDVCHNSEEVIDRIGYDADADVENTADSVFCSHGAGIIVPWYEVEEHMHVESGVKATVSGQELTPVAAVRPVRHTIELTPEELDAIYVRTPDPVKRRVNSRPVTVSAGLSDHGGPRKQAKGDRAEHLLVDGYNIIFASSEFRERSSAHLAAASRLLAAPLSVSPRYPISPLPPALDPYTVV